MRPINERVTLLEHRLSSMETKVDEMHDVLMRAHGVRWAILAFVSLVGFLIGVGTFLIHLGKLKWTIGAAIVFISVIAVVAQANDPHQQHPQDLPIHEQFYSTWYMPDNPSRSCCNKADCYPTEIRMEGGKILARRREDGKYIPIPAHKVERNRDNPDGRNHLCAPPPSGTHPADTVFCFSLGAGF